MAATSMPATSSAGRGADEVTSPPHRELGGVSGLRRVLSEANGFRLARDAEADAAVRSVDDEERLAPSAGCVLEGQFCRACRQGVALHPRLRRSGHIGKTAVAPP